jgi:hypothetical protein
MHGKDGDAHSLDTLPQHLPWVDVFGAVYGVYWGELTCAGLLLPQYQQVR